MNSSLPRDLNLLSSITDEQPLSRVWKALVFDIGEFLEEAWDMYDTTGADKILRLGV